MAMTLSPSSRWLYLYTNVVPIVAVNLVRCVLGDQSEPMASQLHFHRAVLFSVFRTYRLYPFDGRHRVFFHIRSAAGSSQSTRARS